MAFSRKVLPPEPPSPAKLTRQMVGIGMNFAARPSSNPNIENTLIFASELGMLDGDLRVLGVLVQWLNLHRAHINADRLARALAGHGEGRVRAFWAAVGSWLEKDRRFGRLEDLYDGRPVDLLAVGTDFQIERRGADERFEGSCLRVPAGTLRQREGDVLSPRDLARKHAGYRNRVHMGPGWRADVWTALEAKPGQTAAEAARRAYCAFGTAWQVKRDFELLQEAGRKPARGVTRPSS